MIDEKRLIDRIRHDIGCYEADMMRDHELYVRVVDMIRMIEEQPKINRWIPVEEELPSCGEIVHVTVRRGYVEAGYYDYIREEWWKIGDEGLLDVIAWQPVPEPFVPQN